VSIVVDASVALKWVLDEPGSEAAAALRQEELIAPVLWLAEAANALWRGVRIGQLKTEEADNLLSELIVAPVVSFAMAPHLNRALRIATEMGHPIYDCIYLALALHHDTHVITADRRFAAIADRPEMPGRVRLLGSEP
jgi:predicted nucleic acid-binding protein